MKKRYLFLTALALTPLSLAGCGGNEVAPITNKDESTVIKNVKSVDDFLNKKDYKSIAYAYIWNIKDGLKSYKSETNGTVKAKILFVDYDLHYNTMTYKADSAFFSKEISKSSLVNLTNEYYMIDREKLVVSKEENKYDVYTFADYSKISYAVNQYTIQGFVFTDDSILNAEPLSDKGDVISIKYTLDNNLATNLVKVDFKNGGGLSDYPSFKKIEITLTMKRDLTPISYSLDTVYDASRPVLGTAEVRQEGTCTFTEVGEKITIPNESFYVEKLGKTPSHIDSKDEERTLRDNLWKAVEALDFKSGVNLSGAITFDFMNQPVKLSLGGDVAFDIKQIGEKKLYELLNAHFNVEGDETLNTILGIVKMIASDKLGEYGAILEKFKSLDIIYDQVGSFYLVPHNQDGLTSVVLKVKLTDIIDVIIGNIDVYRLATDVNSDLATFTKIEGENDNSYHVEITLNEEGKAKVRASLDKVFSNPSLATLKAALQYKDFDSVKVDIAVANGVYSSADLIFNYVKAGAGEDGTDAVKPLFKAHLEAKNQKYDFEANIKASAGLYATYLSTAPLQARLNELLTNVYVSRGYLTNLNKAYEEYQALDEAAKAFFPKDIASSVASTKTKVEAVLSFLEVVRKTDWKSLNNETILSLAKAYYQQEIDSSLLQKELDEETYGIVTDLSSSVDYSSLEGAISKFVGEDETAWGLTETEIRGIHLILNIGEYDSGVKTNVQLKLLMGGVSLDIDSFAAKINHLYAGLAA